MTFLDKCTGEKKQTHAHVFEMITYFNLSDLGDGSVNKVFAL